MVTRMTTIGEAYTLYRRPGHLRSQPALHGSLILVTSRS